MKKFLQKQFIYFIAFLLVVAQLSVIQPVTSFANYLEKAVTIIALDDSGSEVVPLQAVEITDSSTAWNVLEKAGAKIDYEEYSFGNLITGINGKSAANENEYWNFIVNGTAASEGASTFKVKHGDHITFILTDNSQGPNNVKVSIKTDDKWIVEETTVNVTKYATAYDAIKKVTNEKNIFLDVGIHNEFLTFINNINNYSLASNEFWEVRSNDSALMVGALGHQLKAEEHIQLVLQQFNTPGEVDKDEYEKEPEQTEDDPSKDKNEEQKKPVLQYKSQIKKELKSLADHVKNNNLASVYGSEWWVWALASAGHDIPKSYLSSVEDEVKSNNGSFDNIFDLEKTIIALSAAGIDASNIAGYNLFEQLISHPQLKNTSVNAQIYALIALNSGKYKIDATVESELIQSILSNEIDGGGWAFFGNEPSVDITAMALLALSNYQNSAEVKAATNRALSFLSEKQDANGGFFEETNGGYTSESVSQLVMALVSLGIDPLDSRFVKEDGDLIQYLLQFKASNGQYKHVLDESSGNPMATYQAMLAFAYYNSFLSEGKAPTPVKPDNKPNENQKEPTKENKNEKNNGNGIVNANSAKNASKGKVEAGKSKVENTAEGKALPKTGTNNFDIIVFGSFILAVGIILIYTQRRRVAK